jgi:elongation factor G
MKLSNLRNIGIIAHVDAGKTTVTERVLFYTGESHTFGEVHHGNTRTDFDAEERKRGITIYSAATTVYWQNNRINIIDTPGHIDFNIEVNRSLRVLDGAVVVFDAVAGVEPQSETNWRLADRYRVPRICYVNKMDRTGADYFRTIGMIESRLAAVAVPVQIPIGSEDGFRGVVDLITQQTYVWPDNNHDGKPYRVEAIPDAMVDTVAQYRAQLIEQVAEFDEAAMNAYLSSQPLSEQQLVAALRAGTVSNRVVPVLCGSAFKNKGIELLLDAVVKYLPSPEERPAINGTDPKNGGEIHRQASVDEPFAALAFKIVNDKHGSLTFVRIYSGQLEQGTTVLNSVSGRRERIGRIFEMHADKREPRTRAQAGDIVTFAGLKHTMTGHTLCDPERPVVLESIVVPEPVIDIAIELRRSEDQNALIKGLQSFVSEDPSLSMKQDPETGQLVLSGMGELQLEVTLNKLEREFNVAVNTGKPRVAYRETISSKQEIRYVYKKQTGGPGQFAEVQLRFEPLERGAGFEFENTITGGAIPREYIPSVEAGIRRAANAGILAGYPVVDFKASLLDGSFHAQDSSTLAFEKAGFLAFQEAAKQAKPVLLEPIMSVEVETPNDYLGDCIGDLNRRRGLIRNQEAKVSSTLISAYVPLANMFGYIGDLRALTSGRASYTMQFDHYAGAPAGTVR